MSICKVLIFLAHVPLALPYRHAHFQTSQLEEKSKESRLKLTSPRTVIIEPPKDPGSEKCCKEWPMPHCIGVFLRFHSGEIEIVIPWSQAGQLGLEAGQYITEVDHKAFSLGRMKRALLRSALMSSSFQLTVESPSWLFRTVTPVLRTCMLIVALVVLISVVVLPFAIYSFVRYGFRSSGANRILGHLGIKVLVVVQAVCALGLGLLDWHTSDIINKTRKLGDAACVFGIILGCLDKEEGPLLSTPLQHQNEQLLQKFQRVSWTLCSISVLSFAFGCSDDVYHATLNFGSDSFLVALRNCQTLIVHISSLLSNFLVFRFTCLVSHMCVAASQQVNDIAAKLPCKALEFEEQVHKPCADLLQLCPPQLSRCGWPVMLVTLGSVASASLIYKGYRDLSERFSENDVYTLLYGLQLIGVSCKMAACLWPLSGVFLLSSAKQRLLSSLNEARQSDASLHLQVEGVEAMLDKVNDGQGWGIPVFRGLVLSTNMLKMLCLRLLVACTAIIAFLDSQMGFEREEESLDFKLDYMTHLLRNKTS